MPTGEEIKDIKEALKRHGRSDEEIAMVIGFIEVMDWAKKE